MQANYPRTLTLAACKDLLIAAGVLLSCENVDVNNANENLNYPSFDSRDIKSGALFYCKGAHFKPQYLRDAIAAGASAYVSEQIYDAGGDLPALIVSDIRAAMAVLDAAFFRGLTSELSLIGITGTKGKSTIAYFLRSILDVWADTQNKQATAILSSIDNYDGVLNEESHLTTQENLELYHRFNNAYKSGIKHLTMEVSSQALKYQRAQGIEFDVACFTNIGNDHVSAVEHADFDDYLDSKLKIFDQCYTAIVNLGTDELDRVLAVALSALDAGRLKNMYTIALEDGVFGKDGSIEPDFYAYNIKQAADGSGQSFMVHTPTIDAPFETALLGSFNVENALCAIAAAWILKTSLFAAQEGLRIARVPGRMELFAAENNKLVIVDYAHNKMSFEALFSAMRKQRSSSAITAVFGCPGYKAYDRRADLGRIAGKYAQDVILTEEDSGQEPTEAICASIAKYVREVGGNARIVVDREHAICSAIEQAPAGGTVLITGKGRETRQKRKDEYVPVKSDVQIVEDYINSIPASVV